MFGSPAAPAASAPVPAMSPAQINPVAAAQRVAAAQAAGGQGYGDTIKTGALGAPAPSTAKQTLGS